MSAALVRIAVDAMGGDYAPRAIVEGAVNAVTPSDAPFSCVLLGDKPKLDALLDELHPSRERIEVVHTTQVVEMSESPTNALRNKKDSSLVRGFALHKEGDVDAFVSAGNTGAVLAGATLLLGRIHGVSRPTIGTAFPNETGVCIVFDAGASVDCKPRHLVEFAMMGSVYVETLYGISSPKVGLLNVGEEKSKGNELSIKAYELLEKAPVNFVGNVEGKDVLKGTVEVVVCDGFVGNIILKFAEGVIGLLKKQFQDYAKKSIMHTLWMGLMSGTLKKVLSNLDYQKYGGVPLLGVNGVTIIGHGKSSPLAVQNMILKAHDSVAAHLNMRIEESLRALIEPT